MKKRTMLLVFVCFLCLVTSCELRMLGFEDPSSIPDNVIVVRVGESVTLNCNFQNPVWYKCDDFEGNKPFEISRGSSYEVPVFNNSGINYYKCSGSDGQTKVFAVGCSALPQIRINTNGKEIKSKITYVDATMDLYDKKGKLSDDDFPLQIRGRGNSSWFKLLKKGYKLKFESKKKILGLSKSKSWPLIPNGYDPTLLGNWFAGYIRKNIFDYGWNPSYEFCDLFINDNYLGTYVVAEGIKIGSSRIDIQGLDELEDDVNGDGKIDIKDGGFLLEISMKRDGDMPFTTAHGVGVALSEPSGIDITAVKMRDVEYFIRDLMNRLEASIYGETSENYEDLLDIDSFVDWYLVNEYLDNNDASLHMSVYMYYNPSDSKLHMGPCWDFDHYVSRSPLLGVDVERGLWVHELLKKTEIRTLVLNRWNSKKSELLSAVNNIFLEEANEIKDAAVMNALRWNLDKNYLSTVSDMHDKLVKRFNLLDNYFTENYK